MMSKRLLEGLYLGAGDEEELLGPPPRINLGKVTILLDRYREILGEIPAADLEALGRVPPEMLRRMGEMGLFGLIIPLRHGGLGLNLHEYLWLVERMVGLDLSVSLVSLAHLSIGTKGIALFGSDSQKDRYLVPAAAGEMIFAFALTEPLVGSDAQHIQTRAELSEDGEHYILNGQKTYITNANYARGLTTFAQMDPHRPGSLGAFIIEAGWEGVKIGKDMPKMGLRTSSTAAVIFRNVRVPVANLLGKPGDGFKIAMSVLNFGRLALGAASSGVMSQSLRDMLSRGASRAQFGRPIRDYPLIQEKLVRTRVHQAVSASINEWVANLLEEDPLGPVAIETSHCKLYGTTRGWEATYDALQVAGGAGYLTTHPYEKRMRDFRVTTVFEGTTEIHSIYPAIQLLRGASRQRGGAGSRGVGTVLRGVFWVAGRSFPGLSFSDPDLRKAVRFCRGSVRAIRRLLLFGLLKQGPRAWEDQFFLRRITFLSLGCFSILALVRKLTSQASEGGLSEEDRAILRYAVAEAKGLRHRDGGLGPALVEKHHDEVMAHLLLKGAGPGPGTEDPGGDTKKA
jgi:acyl-CoA dehydrogenase family protein 9